MKSNFSKPLLAWAVLGIASPAYAQLSNETQPKDRNLGAALAGPSPAPSTATPISNPASWITLDDYPPAAARAGLQGVVRFQLSIDENGRVATCKILTSSGSAELDAVTCTLVTRRARFTPRVLTADTQYAATYSTSVRWALPKDFPSNLQSQPYTNRPVARATSILEFGSGWKLATDGQTFCSLIGPDPQRGVGFSWSRFAEGTSVIVFGNDIGSSNAPALRQPQQFQLAVGLGAPDSGQIYGYFFAVGRLTEVPGFNGLVYATDTNAHEDALMPTTDNSRWIEVSYNGRKIQRELTVASLTIALNNCRTRVLARPLGQSE